MSNIFILLSHKLTIEQIEAIRNEFNITNIIYMPDNLHKIWSNIPPELETIYDILNPFRIWIKENAKPDDYVLIQGDMGATYQMINYCFSINLIPCYTTTKRVSIQEHNNNGTVNVVKEFRHVKFRMYENKV